MLVDGDYWMDARMNIRSVEMAVSFRESIHAPGSLTALAHFLRGLKGPKSDVWKQNSRVRESHVSCLMSSRASTADTVLMSLILLYMHGETIDDIALQ